MYLKRTSSWIFCFIINLERQKLKFRKAKQNFCNADAEVNADADADISKWSWEPTMSYLGKKNSGTENRVGALLNFQILFAFDFSLKLEIRARSCRTAWSFQIFLMATCLFLYSWCSSYKLCTCCTKNVTCCTKKCYVNKKNISYRSYVAHRDYVSHKKLCCGNKINYEAPNKEAYVD